MSEYKWACIVNPVAGNGYAGSHIEAVKEGIGKIDSQAPVVLTERPGHAAAITEDLLSKGYDTILVAGGDGTVHEAGSVLVDRKDAVLGIISSGTGNDYNYLAGFPERFKAEQWEAIKKRNVSQFDVGVCNGQYFFNGMGLGFDAAMTAESHADRERTGKSGKGRYTWIILKTLLGYRETGRKMVIDGAASERTSFLTTVAIGKRFAGSYHLTPRAVADDGLLDICDIDPLSLPDRLNILLKVPGGRHLDHKAVNYINGRTCLFEFAEDVPAHLDGELIFSRRFDISIKEKSLNIITNFG